MEFDPNAATIEQLTALAEYAYHYNAKVAADCMGLSVTRFKRLLYESRTASGTTLEALTVLGWLTVPPALISEHHAAGQMETVETPN